MVKQKPTVVTESKQEPSVRQAVAGTERKSYKNTLIYSSNCLIQLDELHCLSPEASPMP